VKEGRDERIWRWDYKGQYTVKSAYAFLINRVGFVRIVTRVRHEGRQSFEVKEQTSLKRYIQSSRLNTSQ